MAFSAELKSKFVRMLRRNKIDCTVGWSNYMETARNPAALVIDVGSEQELQTVLKEVNKLNTNKQATDKITVRATAGWEDKKSVTCCLFPWQATQENEYDESFSFSQVVGGRASSNTPGTDIIIRFKKKFHHAEVIGPIEKPDWANPNNPIHQLPFSLVEVSAGMQIAEYAEFLRQKGLSSTTISMLCWASVVGLTGTAGHGTGRDEPAFSGLIESIRICDWEGNIRDLSAGHPDFEVLRGGHSGLLGVILSVRLRAVQAFNLCETVELFHNTAEMKEKLGAILKDNQYVSILGMPSSSTSELSKDIHQWQIRKWNYTPEKPSHTTKPTYAPDTTSFLQELELKLGASLMQFLLEEGLTNLLPSFMLLAATESIELRGTKSIVDFENHITHPQVAFPKVLRDVDYFIPVKEAEAGDYLEGILGQIEEQIARAAKKGNYPLTYAIYVRHLKGTNGGLSTSSTQSPDERVLALDVVTHPNATGIVQFEQEFMAYLKSKNLRVRNHLGKEFPSGVTRYDQFLDKNDIDEFIQALERWYATPGCNDGAEQLAKSPFLTPYLQMMLDRGPLLQNQAVAAKATFASRTPGECTAFLTGLCHELEKLEVPQGITRKAKDAFLEACQHELDARVLDAYVIV